MGDPNSSIAESTGWAGISTPVTLAAMQKPVQWMTVDELLDELERTRPAWESEPAALDEVFDGSKIPALGESSHRHQQLAEELMRRPS